MIRVAALATALVLLGQGAAAADAASGGASLGRVIVQFKPGAAALRERALAAGASETEVRSALDARARSLGARRGLTLAAGAAVGPRSQVMLASGVASAALAHRLAQDADVEYAVPDERRRRFALPDDPLYASGGAGGPAVGQWYLRPPAGEVVSSINAQSAWDITTGSASVVVAVLDTGVRFDHADLAGKVLPGFDMISDAQIANDGGGRDADASDPGDWVTAAEAGTPPFDSCSEAESSSWHGTKTASLIGAATNNALGMAGIGWQVKLLPVRVLGKCAGFDSDILAGMRWAAGLAVPGVAQNATPARVINLSLGGEGACSDAYRNTIAEVAAAGATVVAAAGNSTGRAVGTPANCPGAIGVAALRHIGTKVGFSDLGPEIAVAAPGGNCVNLSGACLYPILTASNAGTTSPVPGSSIYTDAFNVSVGTSFAAPLVAGVAALMVSAKPQLAAADVRSLMRSTARPFPTSGAPPDDGTPVPMCRAPGDFDQLQCYCTTTTCGAGMLDAAAAVAAAASVPVPPPGEPPVEPPVTGGGGGGGATSGLALWGLALAALLLRRRTR
jgi:serine protease